MVGSAGGTGQNGQMFPSGWSHHSEDQGNTMGSMVTYITVMKLAIRAHLIPIVKLALVEIKHSDDLLAQLTYYVFFLGF